MVVDIYGPAPPPTAHSLGLPPLPVIPRRPRRQREPSLRLPDPEYYRIMAIQVHCAPVSLRGKQAPYSFELCVCVCVCLLTAVLLASAIPISTA